MRLTLRTMLAYLDDLLDSDDEEQLAAKIRESDFASGLVHRIRGTVGRARLSSPQVLGKGLAADANTVAEYLDNTLSADRVPDFEKICLESDLHLSEVASCHQILTLVLGEPAAMGPHLRQRIYDLPGSKNNRSGENLSHRQAEQVHPELHERKGTHPMLDEQAPLRTHRQDPQHLQGTTQPRPDYMPAPGTGRTKWLATAILLLAAVGLGAWSWYSLGVGRPDRPLTTNNLPTLTDVDSPKPNDGSPQKAESFEAFLPPPTANSDETNLIGIESQGPHTTPPDLPLADLPPASGMAEGGESTDASITDATISETPPTVVATERPEDVGGVSALDPASSAGHTTAAPHLPAGSLHGEPVTPGIPSTDSASPNADMASIEGAVVRAATPPVASAPPAPRNDIHLSPTGISSVLYTDNAILAHFDAAQGGWIRTPSQTPLPAGLRLRAASTFRPRMRIGENLDLQLIAGTELLVDPAPSPSITLMEGQIVVGNIATTPETSESLTIGTRAGRFVITLPNVGTFVAFEATPASMPGSDPRESDPGIRCRAWVAGGMAAIQLPSGEQTDFPEGAIITIQPDGIVGIEQGPVPAWSFTQDLRNIDRQAQDELLASLDPNVPLTESLMAIVSGRRTDVQSVAARVLASLGQLEPIIQYLDDPKHHPSWRLFFAELQRAVRHNKESAHAVDAALKKQFPADAEPMFRMLWGYADSQLVQGEAKRLVGYLDDPRRMIRVLAFENLVQITGKPGTYRANMPPSRMREAIRGWQKRLEAGEIGGMPVDTPSEATAVPPKKS